VFNDGMLTLPISLGHQSRLFDTIAGLDAAISEQIARAAELDEPSIIHSPPRSTRPEARMAGSRRLGEARPTRWLFYAGRAGGG
jgi:hypothetical protein